MIERPYFTERLGLGSLTVVGAAAGTSVPRRRNEAGAANELIPDYHRNASPQMVQFLLDRGAILKLRPPDPSPYQFFIGTSYTDFVELMAHN